jgi:hypothetical protein
VGGTGSESFPVVDFGIRGVEPSYSAMKECDGDDDDDNKSV